MKSFKLFVILLAEREEFKVSFLFLSLDSTVNKHLLVCQVNVEHLEKVRLQIKHLKTLWSISQNFEKIILSLYII